MCLSNDEDIFENQIEKDKMWEIIQTNKILIKNREFQIKE